MLKSDCDSIPNLWWIMTDHQQELLYTLCLPLGVRSLWVQNLPSLVENCEELYTAGLVIHAWKGKMIEMVWDHSQDISRAWKSRK